MNRLKVLISPLSWGFGHAGRMIPLARELQRRGCEVIFAADAYLLRMAWRELPGVTMIEMPGLRIRYSRFLPQYVSVFIQMPLVVASAVKEHSVLRRLIRETGPSVIISDNRFGFYNRDIFSVYVTHQVRIVFPGFLRWLEPVAEWAHRIIINRYNLCIVPDYPGEVNLSGRLSHGGRMPGKLTYMGPLSRFAVTGSYMSGESGEEPAGEGSDRPGDLTSLPEKYACLILSGPEPQRSLLLEKVTVAADRIPLAVMTATPLRIPPPPGAELHIITAPSTATMRRIISGASLVVTRAGYTSVMELVSLRRGAVLIPTPGQTEQEYIGRHLDGRFGFVTMKQNRLEKLVAFAMGNTAPVTGTPEALPDPLPLLEKTIALLLENKKQ